MKLYTWFSKTLCFVKTAWHQNMYIPYCYMYRSSRTNKIDPGWKQLEKLLLLGRGKDWLEEFSWNDENVLYLNWDVDRTFKINQILRLSAFHYMEISPFQKGLEEQLPSRPHTLSMIYQIANMKISLSLCMWNKRKLYSLLWECQLRQITSESNFAIFTTVDCVRMTQTFR